MQTFRKRRTGLSATAGLSCCNYRIMCLLCSAMLMTGASLVGKDGADDLVQELTADGSRQFTLLLPAFSDQEQRILPSSISPHFSYPHPEPSGLKVCYCTTCGQQFTNYGLHALHRCLHQPATPAKCSVCERRFSRSTDLQRHVCQQSSKDVEYPDGVFDRRYSDQNRPKKHKVEPSLGQIFSCSVCCKQFRSNSHLIRHQQVHTGERPYQCAVCDKRFSEPSSVKRHMYIHTNEAPHACPTCGHRYSSPCYLREHMLSHTGERPNKCPVCDKQYSRSGHLTRHLRQHTHCRAQLVCDLAKSELGGYADDGQTSPESAADK